MGGQEAEETYMIPRIIHYCWFGGNQLSERELKCIESWKAYCPGYEIREWNECNFDLSCCDYVKEAYRRKKWAFVSDYARFWILYQYGGLYFDTDVELIKSIDDIIAKGPFMGCESQKRNAKNNVNNKMIKCAPGLGLGATPNLDIYKEMLDLYQNRHFIRGDGSLDMTTVVEHVSAILEKHGWDRRKSREAIQQVDGIWIYPAEYFCPMDYATGELYITGNTRSVHHYTASWKEKEEIQMKHVADFLCKYLPMGISGKLAFAVCLPLRFKLAVKRYGFSKSIAIVVQKVRMQRK